MRPVIKYAGLLAAVLCASAVWANNPGSVEGVVKGATGQPVSGAYVKLVNSQKGLTIMVVSQERGHYTVKNLLAGTYTAQAIGGEFQSDKIPVDVTATKPAVADLSLSVQRAPALAPGWPGTPGTVGGGEEWSKNPVPDLPAGPGAEIALAKCGQCHAPSWFLSFRGERENWAALIDSMRSNIAATPVAKDFTEDELKTLTDYFAAHFSRPRADENSRLPRTLAKGNETKYVVVDFKIPRIEAESHEMTVDARGNGVVGERNGGVVGLLDPDSYAFKEFTPPQAGSPRVRIGAISNGRGDTVWMLDGGPNHRWMELNTKTGEFRSFPVPENIKGRGNGNTIRQHPNGTVWVASGGGNGMVGLDPATGKFTLYPAPEGIKSGRSVGPYGFAVDGGGSIWFAEYANNGVGRLDPETGKIDEYKSPIAGSVPRKVGVDNHGNIWVALHETGQLLKIDYKNPSDMKTFLPPSEHPGTYSPCGDLKNGYVWVSEQSVDKLARFDPKTEKWAEFSVPYPETDLRRIEIDQAHPNRIWWTGTLSGHFGYVEMLNN
jgi:virginiamycin B lyase